MGSLLLGHRNAQQLLEENLNNGRRMDDVVA